MEWRHAAELWPRTRDARVVSEISTLLAVVYMWSGDRDAALDQLWQIANLAGSPSAGDLKLNPVWDDLRNDPRFERIIAKAVEPIKLD